ncbi:MAG: hypothetical protein ACK554_04795 [Erythrobacteraceae bacterium]|jgi:nicotinamide riboside transporter PnuC
MGNNSFGQDRSFNKKLSWIIAVSLAVIGVMSFFLIYQPHQQKKRCEYLMGYLDGAEVAVQGVSLEALERYELERQMEYLNDCTS